MCVHVEGWMCGRGGVGNSRWGYECLLTNLIGPINSGD